MLTPQVNYYYLQHLKILLKKNTICLRKLYQGPKPNKTIVMDTNYYIFKNLTRKIHMNKTMVNDKIM